MTILQFISDNFGWIFLFCIFAVPAMFEGVTSIIRELKAAPEPKQLPRAASEGRVYNVIDASSGRSEIVHAEDPEDACRIAAESLGADEDDLEATEVYDRVLRR